MTVSIVKNANMAVKDRGEQTVGVVYMAWKKLTKFTHKMNKVNWITLSCQVRSLLSNTVSCSNYKLPSVNLLKVVVEAQGRELKNMLKWCIKYFELKLSEKQVVGKIILKRKNKKHSDPPFFP